MSYFPNIPAATDDPSVSQSAIQTNFGTINTAFALNHVALGSGGSQGKHNFVEMPVQGATPTTIVGEGTLYTLSATGSQLNYVADNNATDLYRMTRAIHASYPLFGVNTNNYNGVGANFTGGWTFLPGGILLQYGKVLVTSSTQAVAFPVVFTGIPFTMSFTFERGAGTSAHNIWILTGSLSTTGFTYVTDSTNNLPMYWTAIGV
jgi:hypothetical protein